MQTQQPDSETIEHLPASPKKSRGRVRRWLTGLGALLVVGVVIASSVIVFSLAARGSHGNQGNGQTPPAGQWKAVQQGYLFFSIKAAASNPVVLYACATTSATVSNQGTPGVVTVLRSADSGDTWQNIGAKLLQGSNCQLAVNPANSDEVYVFGGETPQAPAALHHSADGGKTWQTIQPQVFTTSTPATQRVVLEQLTFSGKSLLAIDWSVLPLPKPIASPRVTSVLIPRLVRSDDNGLTWKIIDSQFNAQDLGAQSFAVDPSNPNTIYELLGRPLLPIQPAQSDAGVTPPYGNNQQLYKTTDGGANWTLALAQVPYGSQVQIASSNPSLVYVGGVMGPIPLTAQGTTAEPVTGGMTLPIAISGFHLQVSRDGGASWKTAPTPPEQGAILNWSVTADGQVIASPTTPFVSPGVSATGVAGTGVAVPPATPRSVGGQPPVGTTINGGAAFSPANGTPAAKSYILRFDPASNNWSKLVTPPQNGTLLNVTTSASQGWTMLWFMGVGTSGTTYTLYRYVIG